MESNFIEYIIVFTTAYLLTMLALLAYKAALNDLYIQTRIKAFREFRAVHPLALLAGLVSLIPAAYVRMDEDSTLTTFGIMGGVALYFITTLLYRRMHNLKVMDFSIDNGSNFNDEVNADPTIAQKVWLYLVSWAGAITLGTAIGFTVSYNSWKDKTDVLTDFPPEDEAQMYLYFFLGLIGLSMLLFWMLRANKRRKLPTAAKIRRAINRAWFIPAWFGLFIAFLQVATRNQVLTNRFWTIGIIVIIVISTFWQLIFVAPNARRHMEEDRKFFEERQKRLRRQRNKKRKKNRR